LVTDSGSRAVIAVADIGQVEVYSNSRVRLVRTGKREHRLALDRGSLHAKINAPPRLFFVDTPSAVAVDIGCAYTLSVDDNGATRLHVDGGWVMLVHNGRESMVPDGAVCVTQPGIGPGTPYFEDASERFLKALTRFDFEKGTDDVLRVVLAEARKRDTITLINLLHWAGAGGEQRSRVYDRLAELVPPPTGVTKPGVMKFDQHMLELWMKDLTWVW
jgi:hypothetical protein